MVRTGHITLQKKLLSDNGGGLLIYIWEGTSSTHTIYRGRDNEERENGEKKAVPETTSFFTSLTIVLRSLWPHALFVRRQYTSVNCWRRHMSWQMWMVRTGLIIVSISQWLKMKPLLDAWHFMGWILYIYIRYWKP